MDKAGIVLIIIALYIIVVELLRKQKYKGVTTGTLIRVEERCQMSGVGHLQTYYIGIYEYMVGENTIVVEGKEHKTKASTLVEGSKAKIEYNLKNEEDCIINGKTQFGIIGYIMLAVGFILIAVKKLL